MEFVNLQKFINETKSTIQTNSMAGCIDHTIRFALPTK